MLIIYRLDRPEEVFATHGNSQLEDIQYRYDKGFYGAVRVPYDPSLVPGCIIPEGGEVIYLV